MRKLTEKETVKKSGSWKVRGSYPRVIGTLSRMPRGYVTEWRDSRVGWSKGELIALDLTMGYEKVWPLSVTFLYWTISDLSVPPLFFFILLWRFSPITGIPRFINQVWNSLIRGRWIRFQRNELAIPHRSKCEVSLCRAQWGVGRACVVSCNRICNWLLENNLGDMSVGNFRFSPGSGTAQAIRTWHRNFCLWNTCQVTAKRMGR